MRRYLILLTVLLSFLSVQTAAANLVLNGDFGTGNFEDWTVIQPPNQISVSLTNTPSGFGYAALFGSASIPDEILQSIATVKDQKYIFDFWLKQNGTDNSNNFQASWNGVLVKEWQNSGAFDWTHYSFTVTATDPSSIIAFSGYESTLFYFLDDVNVSAVPLPGTLVLLGSGLLPLLGWRRFRKS